MFWMPSYARLIQIQIQHTSGTTKQRQVGSSPSLWDPFPLAFLYQFLVNEQTTFTVLVLSIDFSSPLSRSYPNGTQNRGRKNLLKGTFFSFKAWEWVRCREGVGGGGGEVKGRSHIQSGHCAIHQYQNGSATRAENINQALKSPCVCWTWNRTLPMFNRM